MDQFVFINTIHILKMLYSQNFLRIVLNKKLPDNRAQTPFVGLKFLCRTSVVQPPPA